MSGNSPATEAALGAERANTQRMQAAYGVALPALQQQGEAIRGALNSGGEPDYLKRAYAAVRGSERQNLALGETGLRQAGLMRRQGAIQGGNVGALTPEDYGARMAGALYGNRVQEAMGGIEQLNKLYGFGIGQSQEAGSGALQATGNELRDIGMMRNYNPTYANVLGALNAAGSIYGAGSQAGWFGGGGNGGNPPMSQWQRNTLAAGYNPGYGPGGP